MPRIQGRAWLPVTLARLQAPQIVLLKDGTDTSQGTPQLISNINACTAVADVVRTTLGPRGMDKLIDDAKVLTQLACNTVTCDRNPSQHENCEVEFCNCLFTLALHTCRGK